MGQTLHQAYLLVSDLERSRAFYQDTLGLSVLEEGTNSLEFDTGQCTLKLQADFDVETLDAFGLAPPGEVRGDGLVIVLEVDQVDPVVERVKRAGETVLSPPQEVAWGRKMALVRDPDGYVLEVSRPV